MLVYYSLIELGTSFPHTTSQGSGSFTSTAVFGTGGSGPLLTMTATWTNAFTRDLHSGSTEGGSTTFGFLVTPGSANTDGTGSIFTLTFGTTRTSTDDASSSSGGETIHASVLTTAGTDTLFAETTTTDSFSSQYSSFTLAQQTIGTSTYATARQVTHTGTITDFNVAKGTTVTTVVPTWVGTTSTTTNVSTPGITYVSATGTYTYRGDDTGTSTFSDTITYTVTGLTFGTTSTDSGITTGTTTSSTVGSTNTVSTTRLTIINTQITTWQNENWGAIIVGGGGFAFAANTVLYDDGVGDMYVLEDVGATMGVLTDLFGKVSAATTYWFTDFVSASNFALTFFHTSEFSTSGSSGTSFFTGTTTYYTTALNTDPGSGVWLGTFCKWTAPSDTRATVEITSSSTYTGSFDTDNRGGFFAASTYTDIAFSTFTTSFLTTSVNSVGSKNIILGGGIVTGPMSFTVTATTQNTFVTTVSSTYTRENPGATSPEVGAGVTLSGACTALFASSPLANSYLASQFGFGLFNADSPAGAAPFGDSTSGATGSIFRNFSFDILSTNTGNAVAQSYLEALGIHAWGIMAIKPFKDYGGAQAQIGPLLEVPTHLYPFTVALLTTSTTTVGTTDTAGTTTTSATTEGFSTGGTLQILAAGTSISTNSTALSVALIVPHSTTRSTTTSTDDSTMISYASATARLQLDQAIAHTDIEPWEGNIALSGAMGERAMYGGRPMDRLRADLLQYCGVEVDITRNSSGGMSADDVSSFTGFSTKSAATDCLVFERHQPLWEVAALRGGGGPQMTGVPRFPFNFEVNPSP